MFFQIKSLTYYDETYLNCNFSYEVTLNIIPAIIHITTKNVTIISFDLGISLSSTYPKKYTKIRYDRLIRLVATTHKFLYIPSDSRIAHIITPLEISNIQIYFFVRSHNSANWFLPITRANDATIMMSDSSV